MEIGTIKKKERKIRGGKEKAKIILIKTKTKIIKTTERLIKEKTEWIKEIKIAKIKRIIY